jgi:hypothetical protein
MTNAQSLALIIPMLLGVAVSFLTELLTKSAAPQGVKSLVSVALSALAGAVSTVVFDPHAAWTLYVGAIFTAWLAAIATHYTGATRILQDASPNFGLGPKDVPVPTWFTAQEDDVPPDIPPGG